MTDTELQRQTNQWAMFLHFSLLAGSVVPLGGVSSLVGRLQLRPLGRLYVTRDAGDVPSFVAPF